MIKASDAIEYGRSLLGTPYGSGPGELDCINFIKKIIRDCPGGDKKYTDAHVPALWASYDSSPKYRHLTYRQESIDSPKIGMLAFKGKPFGYDHQPSHVGLITGQNSIIHASSAKGCVVETELLNGQWTLLGTSSMIQPEDGTQPEPEPEPGSEGYSAQVIAIKNNNPVNLRSGPGTQYDIITKVPVGTIVEVTVDLDDGWSFIDTGRNVGYMASQYLSPLDHDDDEPDPVPDPDPDEPGEWMVNQCLISETGAVIHLDGRWRLAED